MTSPQNPYGPTPPGQPASGGQPPPVHNPYGPPPGYPQGGDAGHPPPGHPAGGPPPNPGTGGWGPYPPVPQRRGQRDSEPGRFTWWDLGATLFYVGGFLSGLVGLIGLFPTVN